MGFMDKLKAGAEEVKSGAGEASTRARETMQDAQVRRDLQQRLHRARTDHVHAGR